MPAGAGGCHVRLQAPSVTSAGRDDPHPIRTLARLALPVPRREADVAADYDRWVRENVPDALDRLILLDRSGGPVRTRREDALLDLLAVLAAQPGAWPGHGSCGRALSLLAEIEYELKPPPAVLSHLGAKGAAYVKGTLDRTRGDPGRLSSFLEGSPLRVSPDGTATLAFGATARIDDLLLGLGSDGMALYGLRARLEGDPIPFDAAALVHREALAPALERAVGQLFERDAPPPHDFLASFRGILPAERWLPTVLRALGDRAGLRDGIKGVAGATQWLHAVAGSEAWTPNDIRRLVRMEALFENAPEAFMASVISGARAVQGSEPGSGVFAALSLLHLARRRRAVRCELVDAEREAAFAHAVEALPLGNQTLRLHAQLSDLPTNLAGTGTVWPFLGSGEKALWRWRARESVGGEAALRRGLAEFLIAWTPRDVYGDVEPLVLDILPPTRELDFLHGLARSCDRLTSLRAGCLAREVPFDLPG